MRANQADFPIAVMARVLGVSESGCHVWRQREPSVRARAVTARVISSTLTVVHRSAGSGTTFNWVNYLSKVSADWKGKVGEGTSVAWPTGVGGKGNEGVAEYVSRIKGSISYVE